MKTRPVSSLVERVPTQDGDELVLRDIHNYASDGEEDEFNLIYCEENFNTLLRRAKEL